MKSNTIKIRLSDEELNQLRFKALSANVSMSEYLRESINNSEIKYNDAKDFASLIASLNWIGNNINQIARVLNIANKQGNLSDIDYNDLIDALYTIHEQVKEVIKC